jgi:hypothetical protein
MYDKGSLSLQSESGGEKRPSGRSIGALDRHSRKSGGFIEDHHGIVFVKHGKLPRETGLPPILAGTATALSWKLLHWHRG